MLAKKFEAINELQKQCEALKKVELEDKSKMEALEKELGELKKALDKAELKLAQRQGLRKPLERPN